MVKKRHSVFSNTTLDKARKLWQAGLIKDRPTLKTEFSAGQRSYITKLTNKFAHELEKPELYVFRSVSRETAKQLASVNYKVANNTVAIRAPYGAKVRITKKTITIDNIFEKNTVFLTKKDFFQTAEKYKTKESFRYNESQDRMHTFWRFSDGSDVSSKLYDSLNQVLNDLNNYPRDSSKKLPHGALPVLSFQKMSGLFGDTAQQIDRAKKIIRESIPHGTVRSDRAKKRKAKQPK